MNTNQIGYEIDFLAVGDGEKSGDAIALRFGNLLVDSLSLIFALVFSLCAFLSPVHQGAAFIHCAALLGQYLVVATSARNYGRRFVLNVLTEESQAK